MMRKNLKVRTYSVGAKIFLFVIIAISISSLIHIAFIDEIRDLNSGDQSDYILDGYFYLHLGSEANLISKRDGISLFEAADSIRPNISSAGIVFLSSLVDKSTPSLEFVPSLFVFLYGILTFALSKSYKIGPNFFLLFFAGLVPYLYIPTKEAFFILGLMLGLICISKRKLLAFLPISGMLMYLARPEAFYILLFSVFVYLSFKFTNRKQFFLLIAVGTFIYWIALRESITTTSYLFQLAAESVDTGFCKVGPLYVCVPESGFIEHIYLQRVISLIGLPLKWLFDISQLFSDNSLTITTWTLRLALGMQILVTLLIFKRWRKSHRTLDNTQSALLVFAAIYISIYSAILYYQVTRQALLSLHIALIALVISETKSTKTNNQLKLIQKKQNSQFKANIDIRC